MRNKSLIANFVILAVLCAAFVLGAKLLDKQGAFLVQGYMMTPAVAALITRLFFYKPHFRDANLHIGKSRDYLKSRFLSPVMPGEGQILLPSVNKLGDAAP